MKTARMHTLWALRYKETAPYKANYRTARDMFKRYSREGNGTNIWTYNKD